MENKKKMYGYIIIILLIFAACILISILFRKEVFYQNTKQDLGNGIKVTDRKIVRTNGWHSLLSPNSCWLPNDIENHGYRLEVHYPIISIEKNKQAEKEINNQIKQIFGVDQEDIVGFYAGGCDTNVLYECEAFPKILTVTLDFSGYVCDAAHPSLGRSTYHFELSTGRKFDVLDMFIKDNDWVIKLNSLIKKNLEEDGYYINDSMDYIGEIGDYRLTTKGLEICYMPYMGPAPGGGFVCVTIKYEDLDRFVEPNSLLRQVLNERNCGIAN